MTAELDQLAADYRAHGFAVMRGALGRDALGHLDVRSFAVWDRTVDDPAHADRFFRRSNDRGEHVIDRIDPYFDLDPELVAFAERDELQVPTSALIGGPLWVLKDKLIRKEPGVDGYGMHQDYAYYVATGVPASRLVSVLIPLTETDSNAGPLEVAVGWHDRLLTGPGELDPDPTSVDVSSWQTVEAGPGDLVFLHPLALHRSAPNRSASARPMVFVTYGSGPGGAAAGRAMRDFYRNGAKARVDAGGSGLVRPPSAPSSDPARPRPPA